MVALCGAAVLSLGGCDDEPAPQDDTSSTGASSTGAAEGPSSSSSGDPEGSSTGAELSTSTSGTSLGGGTSSDGGDTDETVGASDSDTEGAGDPFDCEILGGVLITEFEAEFPVFVANDEDVVTAPLGTICMNPVDGSWLLRLQFGPLEGRDWSSTLLIQVAQAGTYDLATDFGVPGSGARGPNRLQYALQEGPTTHSFGTQNQAADGTLQVDNWPTDSGDEISIRGDGNIAGQDGWRFQFSISAVLP